MKILDFLMFHFNSCAMKNSKIFLHIVKLWVWTHFWDKNGWVQVVYCLRSAPNSSNLRGKFWKSSKTIPERSRGKNRVHSNWGAQNFWKVIKNPNKLNCSGKNLESLNKSTLKTCPIRKGRKNSFDFILDLF